MKTLYISGIIFLLILLSSCEELGINTKTWGATIYYLVEYVH